MRAGARDKGSLKCTVAPTYNGHEWDQCHRFVLFLHFYTEVSGQAVQPVPVTSLKLSMAVCGQKLDGRPSG